MPAILKSIVNGAMIVFTLATPVHGQGWGWWDQPYQPSYQQPRYQTDSGSQRHHTRRVVHHEHHQERREPVVHTVTKTKVIYQDNTWKNLSQDRAREWIKEQAQSFCGKYPKDEACVKKE